MKTKHKITKYNNGIVRRYKNRSIALVEGNNISDGYILEAVNIRSESGQAAVQHMELRGRASVDTICLSPQSLIALALNAMSILGVTNIEQLYDLEILEIERLRILEEQNQQIISETISEIETDIKRNKK